MNKVLAVALTASLLTVTGCATKQQTKTSALEVDGKNNLIIEGQKRLKKSTPEAQKKFTEMRKDDYSFFQKEVISGTRKRLPVKLDEMSFITDIYQDKNTIVYKIEFKGIPVELLRQDEIVSFLNEDAKKNYCSPAVAMIRYLFPDGIIQQYYQANENKPTLTLKYTPDQCNE